MCLILSSKSDKDEIAYVQSKINLFEWMIEKVEQFEVLAEQHDEALRQNKRCHEEVKNLHERLRKNGSKFKRQYGQISTQMHNQMQKDNKEIHEHHERAVYYEQKYKDLMQSNREKFGHNSWY